jgi:hypothetical protein
MTARRLVLGAALALLALAPAGAGAQGVRVVPDFDIWDVDIGGPVSEIPETATAVIACGTNGGPPSVELKEFEEFASCPAEASGLHEVYFTYDDEQDYIARALSSEYEFLQGGTSVFAHPVMVSVLVDDDGIVRGIRIVTDDRVSDRTRRTANTLIRNFKTRFVNWGLECEDVPPRAGEQPVGRIFIHEVCIGEDSGTGEVVQLVSQYLRKRGQESINRETQQVNSGYFASLTRMDLVEAPYAGDYSTN